MYLEIKRYIYKELSINHKINYKSNVRFYDSNIAKIYKSYYNNWKCFVDFSSPFRYNKFI